MNLNKIRENLSETLGQLNTQNYNMNLLLGDLWHVPKETEDQIKADPVNRGVVEEIAYLANAIQVGMNTMKDNEDRLRSIVYGENDSAKAYMTASSLQETKNIVNMRGSYL